MFNKPPNTLVENVSEKLSEASLMVKDKLNGALNSVEDTVESIYPEIQGLARKADKKMHDGVDSLLNAGEKAQASAKHYAHSVESYVGQKPMQSALIAAAAGALFATLMFRSRQK